jgi:hypothetical protein
VQVGMHFDLPTVEGKVWAQAAIVSGSRHNARLIGGHGEQDGGASLSDPVKRETLKRLLV